MDAFKTIQTFTRVISWEINTTATIENITTKYYVYQNDKIITIRHTGSRNLMGPKTLSTIWHTYMKLVTKYQISAINSCREKCDEKCAYMFNVYKKQLSRQTGSRNLTSQKTLPTILHTNMKIETKYQISAINYEFLRKMRRKISI